jgi:hypothetical protein
MHGNVLGFEAQRFPTMTELISDLANERDLLELVVLNESKGRGS